MKKLAMAVSILAVIALLAMLGLHTLGALFWGSWDQDGLGTTGFWHVFQNALLKRGWAYLIPIGLLVTATAYLRRNKHRDSEPATPYSEPATRPPHR